MKLLRSLPYLVVGRLFSVGSKPQVWAMQHMIDIWEKEHERNEAQA